MAAVASPSVCAPLHRRWTFGNAVFDEARWTLAVDGRTVAIEGKPLEILRLLLQRGDAVVTKSELLDSVWLGLTVVEGSLPTAVAKLRRSIGDSGPQYRIIETVTGVGYRLAVPVMCEDANRETSISSAKILFASRPIHSLLTYPITAILAVLAVIGCVVFIATERSAARAAYRLHDVERILRHLDVDEMDAMLQRGWNPDTPLDGDGNGALAILLNVCEWNPAHDRQRMLQMARALLENGARVEARNKWGDTPYSIAKSPRYCGVNHPVTVMLRRACYSGYGAPGDLCLASYEKQ